MGQPIELTISPNRPIRTDRVYVAAILALALIAPYCLLSFSTLNPLNRLNYKKSSVVVETPHVKSDFEYSLLKCRRLNLLPGPPSDFNQRTESDRFVEVSFKFVSISALDKMAANSSFTIQGTVPTLIRNASIWTGDNDVFKGDLFIDKGLILKIESNSIDFTTLPANTHVVEANGGWMTPGIFDMVSLLSF